MKISELVKKLQKIQSEKGDLETVVQYRDAGGDYEGITNHIYLVTAKTYAGDEIVVL